MRPALRFGPLIAAGAALAVLLGLLSASGAGNSADNFAVDVDTTGNTATSLGPHTECVSVAPGSTVTVDITATNIPPATPMLAFAFYLNYDNTAITISARDNAGLLSTAQNYAELDASDPLPDSDGAYIALMVNIGSVGDKTSTVSGTGYLQRLTLAIAAEAPVGGYTLTLDPEQTVHVDDTNTGRPPDALIGARLAVGVSCEELPSPSPTPAPFANGDVDCNNVVNSVDALKVLRKVANLSVDQQPGCNPIGVGAPFPNGDVDCNNVVNSVDALKILRKVANLPVQQEPGCTPIGT